MSAAFLADLAFKSAVLAVVVLAILAVMRRHRPSHRAAVGGLGLALLALLPLIVAAVAALPVPSIDVPAPETAIRFVPASVEQGAPLFPLDVPEAAPAAVPAADPSFSAQQLAATLWAAGTLFILLRLGAGLLTLRRWTRAARRAQGWASVLRDCGAPEGTALLVSERVAAPLSWGWRSPAILVSSDDIADPGEAEAIIAHEVAHLNRLDWPRLLAARVAVALFWFNPFVWLLERRHLQDVEEAADAEATCRIEPAHYAQTLLNVARGQAAPVGANSMACGTLAKRIAEVLTPREASPRERMWRTSALAGVAMIAAPVAVIQFVGPEAAVAAVQQSATVAQPAPVATAPVVAAPIAQSTAPSPVSVSGTVAPVQPAQPAEPRRRSLVDEQELARVLKEAEEARAQAAEVARDAKQIAERARAEVAVHMANMRSDMLRGAEDMERGAIDMRKGAADMRREARRLRDPAYRAEQIRKAQARGDDHVPTDQELIDAIPKMERGAEKMDAGVEKMRDGAKRMREQARKS